MNELIQIKNGQLAEKTLNYIIKKEEEMNALKKEYEAFKKDLLIAMEENNILKIDTPDILISYVAPTKSEKFDSKAFKEDNPDLYDHYVKISDVKSSIRIKTR